MFFPQFLQRGSIFVTVCPKSNETFLKGISLKEKMPQEEQIVSFKSWSHSKGENQNWKSCLYWKCTHSP